MLSAWRENYSSSRSVASQNRGMATPHHLPDEVQNVLAALGWSVLGCSTQTTEYQVEAVSRLHLPYPLLSDTALVLKSALGLHTFTFEGQELYRRVTLLIDSGVVVGGVDPGDDSSGHVDQVLREVRSLGAKA